MSDLRCCDYCENQDGMVAITVQPQICFAKLRLNREDPLNCEIKAVSDLLETNFGGNTQLVSFATKVATL
jgi:hypothetical protein